MLTHGENDMISSVGCESARESLYNIISFKRLEALTVKQVSGAAL